MYRRLVLVCSLLHAASCAAPPPPQPAAPAPEPAPALVAPTPEMQMRADADRVRVLEVEIERLRADLRAAEETLLAVESGMRGAQGPAKAVSALAEARIEVEHAARRAPWRVAEAAEARAKLTEAERQLAAQHVDSTVFFVSRARRIAEALTSEADRVKSDPGTAFVRGSRVNLRSAPSRDAKIVTTLAARLPVFVEAREGDWALVRTTTGHVGFVFGRLLSPN